MLYPDLSLLAGETKVLDKDFLNAGGAGSVCCWLEDSFVPSGPLSDMIHLASDK